MATSEIRLWPGVPDLLALGAESFEDLMGESGELEGESVAEVRPSPAGCRILRVPLPGTVHQPGKKPSRPRGAGTGYVDVIRWTGGAWSERFGTRFKAPRSSSFAARAWNLLCHLREAGVGTAEPMAMGQEQAPIFAKRSFLVTRALEPMMSLVEYLDENQEPEDQRHLAHALGLFLRRIFQAGVELPVLEPQMIFVSRLKKKPSCAIQKIQEQSSGVAPEVPVPDLSTRALPELALADVQGGRIHGELSIETRVNVLSHLTRRLAPGLRLRCAHYALGNQTDREERRRGLRRWLSLNEQA